MYLAEGTEGDAVHVNVAHSSVRAVDLNHVERRYAEDLACPCRAWFETWVESSSEALYILMSDILTFDT